MPKVFDFGIALEDYKLDNGSWLSNKYTDFVAKYLPEITEAKAMDKHEKHIETIKEALHIEVIPGRTYLYLVIIDEGDPKGVERSKNRPQHIRCHHGVAFGQGYAYDQNNDSYLMNAVDSYAIGHVSVAFQISIPVTGKWRVQIPLPESVIDHYLSKTQKRDIAVYREKYSADRFVVHIVQMSGCET